MNGQGLNDPMDPEKYLVKISLGKALSTDEVDEVASVLHEITPGKLGVLQFADDVYSAIVVLGKAKARQHHQLIAKHLDGNDPQTVSLILEVLCLDWGLKEDYIEWIFRFAVGVSWDVEEDVRRVAIKVLGEYLRERSLDARDDGPAAPKSPAAKSVDESANAWRARNRQLLELLFSIFSDAEADDFTRQAAYCALLRIGGKEWEELPSEFALLDLSDDSPDVDQALLAKLRR